MHPEHDRNVTTGLWHKQLQWEIMIAPVVMLDNRHFRKNRMRDRIVQSVINNKGIPGSCAVDLLRLGRLMSNWKADPLMIKKARI